MSSPKDIAERMRHLERADRERLYVLSMDTKNVVKIETELYRGSVNSALVRPAEVFQDAVKSCLPAVAIVHNHPSGDPAPSPEDVSMTRRLIEAGQVLAIEVLDHVVIGAGRRYVSMKERRLGFD